MSFEYEKCMKATFVFILIIASIVCSYYLSQRNIGISDNSDYNIVKIENFTGGKDSDDLETSSLIKNGSFNNGSTPPDSKNIGNANIIKLKNNKIANYVMSVSGINSYYMINVPVNIGQTYSIKFWCCDKGGNKQGNKLNNVIDFEMQKKTGSGTRCIQFHYKRLKTNIDSNNDTWIYYDVNLSIPTNVKGNLKVFFGYHTPTTKYFAHIEMIKVISKIPTFKETNGLVTLLLPNDVNQLKDLSNNSNHFISKIPLKFNSKNSVNISEKELVGVNKALTTQDGHKIEQFSILFGLDILDNKENGTIISIPGNQNTALTITTNANANANSKNLVDDEDTDYISNYSYITARVGDDPTRYDSPPHILEGNNIYTMTYDNSKGYGVISFYLNKNDRPFWQFNTKTKLYFDSPIKLNEGGKINADFKAFIIYDRLITTAQRIYIVNFVNNYEQQETKSKMEEYIFQSCSPSNSNIEHVDVNFNTNTNNANNANNEFDIDLGGVVLDVSGEHYNGSSKFKKNIDSNNGKLNMTNNYNPLEDELKMGSLTILV